MLNKMHNLLCQYMSDPAVETLELAARANFQAQLHMRNPGFA